MERKEAVTTLRRQMLCPPELRALPSLTASNEIAPLILNHFRILKNSRTPPERAKLPLDRDKTPQFGRSVTKLRLASFAIRFSFCKASRFICSFICEYFLNTFASP